MAWADDYPRRSVLMAIAGGLGSLAGCNTTSNESSPTKSSTSAKTESPVQTNTATQRPTKTPESARFSIESLTVSPNPVRQAHQVTISVTIRNLGGREGEETFSVLIGNRSVDEFSIQLEPGGSSSKQFEFQPGISGEFSVHIGQVSRSLQVEEYPSSFVQRDGVNLMLDGSRYRFHGSNNDMLFRAPEWYIDAVLSAARNAGLRVMRVNGVGVGPKAKLCYLGDCRNERFPFMTAPGEYSEKGFRGMDYAIFKAKQHGIRLVIPFINNWSESGMAQFVEWADSAELHDDFYTNAECRTLFKAFVERFLKRTNSYTGVEYRNDPTILMWELANEPQAHGWNEQREEGGDPAPEKLQSWIEEMAPFIKSIDSNHLLATGGQGFYLDKFYHQNKGESFIRNNSVAAIDACSMHMYPKHWSEGNRFDPESWRDIDLKSLRTHIEDAREVVGKPFYLGEFRPATNIDRREEDWKESDKKRAEIFQRWYDVLANREATGALHWFWYGPMDNETAIVTGEENVNAYNGPHSTYPWDTQTMEVLRSYSEDVGWL